VCSWSLGSQWQRWDPHIHAPGTSRNDQFKNDWEGFFEAIESAAPPPVALGITDYFSTLTYEAVVDRRRSDGRLANVPLVFANIEMRLTVETARRGPVNIHLLVDPSDDAHLKRIKEHLAQLTFEYRAERYPCTRDGLVRLGRRHSGNDNLAERAAHSVGVNQFKVELSDLRDLKSDGWIARNVLFAVAGGEDGIGGLSRDDACFGQRHEICRLVDVVFSGSPKDRQYWLGRHKNFAKEGHSRKPCIHGSDAHEVARVLRPDLSRFTWIRGDASFESLRQAIIEPERRVFVGPMPPSGPTEASTVSSIRVNGAPWFEPSEIAFNDGLVTVIGARGSGKTALVDLVALAAASGDKQAGEASFVHRAMPLLDDLEVTLRWGDGQVVRATPSDDFSSQVPSVQYLSQQFVKRLADGPIVSAGRGSRSGYRLESDGSDELLEEIGRVVFGAIPEEDRARCTSFNELRSSRLGAHLAGRADQQTVIAARSAEIDEAAARQRAEATLKAALKEAERTVSASKEMLTSLPAAADPVLTEAYDKAQEDLQSLQQAIAAAEARTQALEELRTKVEAERRRSIEFYSELRSTFGGLISDEQWETIQPQTPPDASGLLEALTVKAKEHAAALRDNGLAARSGSGTTKALSLRAADAAAKAAAEKLGEDRERFARRDALQQAIHEEEKRIGTLKRQLQLAEDAAARIPAAHGERLDAYEAIIKSLVSEASTLKSLYQPLRERLDNDARLSDLRLRVERRVDSGSWVHIGEDRLFNLGKRPFVGRGALMQAAQPLIQAWKEGDPSTVRTEMDQFHARFVDRAVESGALKLGVDPSDVWSWLFSTDHISVTYAVEFEQVDLRKLSPGARGVVVLLLFLAIDDQDARPLVIDQPEENLDPKSVHRVLVPFFREAARRRQIIMVTHNANLVVNADSDQVIVATAHEREGGGLPRLTYQSGGLEEPHIRQLVCQYLEGGEEAFKKRGQRYL
jgi:hypothetical protein